MKLMAVIGGLILLILVLLGILVLQFMDDNDPE